MSCFPPRVYRDVSPTHYPERRSGRRVTSTTTVLSTRHHTHAGYVEVVTVV